MILILYILLAVVQETVVEKISLADFSILLLKGVTLQNTTWGEAITYSGRPQTLMSLQVYLQKRLNNIFYASSSRFYMTDSVQTRDQTLQTWLTADSP